MARIILHIGTHKTATTTLQDTLAANRALLARHGIVYPKIGRANGHHTLTTHWIVLPKTYHESAPAANFWHGLRSRVADDATVIVSSEELSRWLPQAVDFTELRAFVEGFETRTVICTLRNQLAHLQSVYLQVTRDHQGPPFEAFLNAAIRNNHATGVFLDYGALYDHVLRGFAPDEVIFTSFEAGQRHAGGVIGTFFERLGLPAVALEPLPVGDSNISPEPLAAWAASQIAAPRAAGNGLIALAREALIEAFGPETRSTLYSRAEAARVAEHFAPLNASFEARYRRIDPSFALAPLALASDLVYRGQLTSPFWVRFGRKLHAL